MLSVARGMRLLSSEICINLNGHASREVGLLQSVTPPRKTKSWCGVGPTSQPISDVGVVHLTHVLRPP
jgi:hypothetical protein